jgi:hypothetical protein
MSQQYPLERNLSRETSREVDLKRRLSKPPMDRKESPGRPPAGILF